MCSPVPAGPHSWQPAQSLQPPPGQTRASGHGQNWQLLPSDASNVKWDKSAFYQMAGPAHSAKILTYREVGWNFIQFTGIWLGLRSKQT